MNAPKGIGSFINKTVSSSINIREKLDGIVTIPLFAQQADENTTVKIMKLVSYT